jgi:hypothetical protein
VALKVADGPSLEQGPRRPYWARVSAGQVVMVLAALAAFVLNVNVIRSQEASVMVAVATRELTAGESLDSGMLDFVPIDAENPVVSRLVTQESAAAFSGRVITGTVLEGEFVSVGRLVETATDTNLRAMTVPVDATHAGGGTLIGVGDLVDIISVTEGRARYVVAGAQVLEVPARETGGLVGSSDYFIVIAVDADTALEVAEALQGDSLEVILSTGAPPPQRMSLFEGGPASESPAIGEREETGEGS